MFKGHFHLRKHVFWLIHTLIMAQFDTNVYSIIERDLIMFCENFKPIISCCNVVVGDCDCILLCKITGWWKHAVLWGFKSRSLVISSNFVVRLTAEQPCNKIYSYKDLICLQKVSCNHFPENLHSCLMWMGTWNFVYMGKRVHCFWRLLLSWCVLKCYRNTSKTINLRTTN